MKEFVTLYDVYYICVDSAVLHILPYVIELLRLALLINYVNFSGCENWWLILSEERRQRVCENGALKRILWPRRDEVTEEWITTQ
jgi:hypothetical protein